MARLTPVVSRRVVVLVSAFAITLVLAAAMNATAKLPSDGPAIVDLELAMSPGVFQQIVGFWGSHRDAGSFWVIPDVRASVRIDFLFAIAYAFLISALYRSLCETSGVLSPRRLVVALPWIAALFDWIENALMLSLLERVSPPPAALVRAMAAAAIVKFALLAVAVAFTVSAMFKGDRGRVMLAARYSVLSLLVGTLPVIALDQGRDLLLGLADPSAGRHQAWFIAWTIVWALSVWYWSRVLLDAEAARRPPSKLYDDWARWLPRVAGVLTLFVPGVAFLLVIGGAERGTQWRLVALASWCIGLSSLFAGFVIFRHALPLARGRAAQGYHPRALSKPSAIIVLLSGAFSAGMLIYLTFGALDAGHRFGAVGILSIVAANTVFLGAASVFLSRSRGVPIELLAFACAAVFSLWNDNHDVRLVPLPAALPGGAVRPEMSAAFADWVGRAPSQPGQPVPVIVAASEGGGIRAAYWTSLVLHHLADLPDLDVPDRLFAISSVSGGSFGAAVYAGLRRDAVGPPGRAQVARDILHEQFLAPMVAKAVGGDLLQWFLPFPVHAFDRSSAMEDGFSAAYRDHVGAETMSLPLIELRPLDARDVPVLLLNSTSVELGRRVVASPYAWSRTDVHPDDLDPLDFHRLTQRDELVSTAVHNTARFPYISAAGRLRAAGGQSLGHLVDGGYFENTGAETVLDLLHYLRTAASPLAVRFIVIVVANTPASVHATDRSAIPWRESASLGEVFSPLRALLQTRLARGDLALQRLREAVEPGDVVEFRVCSDSRLREAPLGWQLSNEMTHVLDGNLAQACFAQNVAQLRAAILR